MSVTLQTVYAPNPSPTRAVGYFFSSNEKVDRMTYYLDNIVYLRGMTNPFDIDMYDQHNSKVTCASYCPTGRWIASGCDNGMVRVWCPTNEDKTLVLESRPVSGSILDISWTEDNARMSVVGHGQNGYGMVMNSETGSSLGEVMGHTMPVNSTALKPNRPFRLVTAGDDTHHNFYKGPPFKFEHSATDHSKFVLCIRYSLDGSVYGSVGLDGALVFYNGLTGEKIAKYQFEAGVTTLSFSPDNKQVLLSLMNGKAIVVNVADGKVVETYTIGSEVYQQQCGCHWCGKHKLSLSLNGDLNFLEDGKVRTVRGHGTGITGLCLIPGGFASGDSRGMVLFHHFNEVPYAVWRPDGKNPAVRALAPIGDGSQILVSISGGDLIVLDSATGSQVSTISLKKNVSGVAYNSNLIVFSSGSEYIIYANGAVKSFTVPFEITALALRPQGDEVALGEKNGAVHFFDLNGSETGNVKGHTQTVCALGYSKDGSKIATSSANKDINVWNRGSYSEPIQEGWRFHSLPVTSIQWLSDGDHFITTSKDRSIREWSLSKCRKYVEVPRAHTQMIGHGILIDDGHLLTSGDDGAIRSWNVTPI